MYEIVFNAAHMEEETKVLTQPSVANLTDIISETDVISEVDLRKISYEYVNWI
jgi:hypothetical protein